MKIVRGSLLPCALALLVIGTGFLTGCGGKAATRSIYLHNQSAPPAVHCTDASGHFAGAKPWILGGPCCCTPTPEMFAVNQREGTITAGMTYDSYLALYRQRGIMTELDREGEGFRGLRASTEHVIFGGTKMLTPIPGTVQYEEITSGQTRAGFYALREIK